MSDVARSPLGINLLCEVLGSRDLEEYHRTMTVEARAEKSWVHARGFLSIESARVMAIVNATPDSFADGGELCG